MYQAIEAISTAGTIRPLEPVQFTAVQPPNWKSLVGSLKTSPNLKEDALLIQQDMRREWD